MERKDLSSGSAIKLKNSTGTKNYVIDRVVGRGAHCIAYEAHSTDSVSRTVRIKECFPAGVGVTRNDSGELLWPDEKTKSNSLDQFEDAYRKQIAIQNDERFVNTFIHIVDDICNANNTLYSVVGIDNGVTFADDDTDNLQDVLITIRTLAKVISLYHNNGYLYLDIKPENFLVLPETRDLIKLFDSDTIIKKNDLVSGDISVVPYTIGWAAPEQIMGKKSKISERTDIYAIGAVLFWKIMERCPDNDDIGVYADFEIPEYWIEKYDSRIIPAIKRIFRNTLAASVKRRYEKIEDLIDALDDAIKICSNEEYILPKESISDVYFVGRNKELETIDELLKGKTRVVFIHGFGGIGKTELAKRYVQKNKDQFDVTVFGFYNQEKGIEQFVQDISVKTDDKDSVLDKEQKWKKIEQLCTNKSLFILDNFDVDDDKDLGRLLSWNAKFIITSRNDHSDNCSAEVSQIELNAMGMEDLIPLFVHEFGRNLSEEEDSYVRDIIEEFDNYTMMVPLIARQLRASDMSIADFWEKIDSEGISGFGDDTEEVKHRKDGKITQATLLGHMNHLFDLLGLDDKYKCVLANVKSLEGHRELTKSVYREYTQEKNLSLLNDLIDRGWIDKVYKRDYENDGDILTLALHPIVSQLIKETLDDEKYYQAIIKNTYDKFVELNANPDDEDLLDEIGNVLRVYCDAVSYDSKANLIYEEMFKFISYNYKKGELNVHKVFFKANRFVNSAASEYFYERITDYILDNNVKKIILSKEIESFQDLDRILVLLMSSLYDYYFHNNSSNKTIFIILCVNILLKRVKGLFDNRENVSENSGVLRVSRENVRVIEEFVANFLIYLTVLKNKEGWVVSPNHSFDWEYDLTSNPLIAMMYLRVAEVFYSLYRFFDSLDEKKKADGYLGIYNRIISVLLYYQGEFVIPESFSAEDSETYREAWEEKVEMPKGENGENEFLNEFSFVDLLFCSDRALWRKKIGKSFEEQIKKEHISKENFQIFLNFDFLCEQPAVIRKALLKNSVFDIVYLDEAFSYEDKKQILCDYVYYEIEKAFRNSKSKKLFIQKPDIINLYYGCLEKFKDSIFELAGTSLDQDRFNYYIALYKMLICKKEKDSSLVAVIGKEINSENNDCLPKLLELTKCVYNMGFHKIASAYYEKILALWEDRKLIGKMSQDIWMNYLWTMRITARRLKCRDILDDVCAEISKISISEWIEAIDDEKVDINFKHEMIQECFWNLLFNVSDILIHDGYEAILNTENGEKILANGERLNTILKKNETLSHRIKNTQIGKCYESFSSHIQGEYHWISSDDFDYYLRFYDKQEKYDSNGTFIAGKLILLSALIFNKDKARYILDSRESKLDKKTRRWITETIESYPEIDETFLDTDYDMPF